MVFLLQSRSLYHDIISLAEYWIHLARDMQTYTSLKIRHNDIAYTYGICVSQFIREVFEIH